jgi:hypothetical protein
MHTDDLANLERPRRGLSIRRCVATAILVGVLCSAAIAVEAAVIDRTGTLYFAPLVGSLFDCGGFAVGDTACLRLDPPSVVTTIPTADSPSLSRANGNPWQLAGRWSISLSLFRARLGFGGYRRVLTVSPTSAGLWLRLVNGDDAAAKFDIRVDVFEVNPFDKILATGLRRCESGLSAASESLKQLTLQSVAPYVGGGALGCCAAITVEVSVRMGTKEDDTSCGGSESETASGLRVVYGAPEVLSAVTLDAHEEPEAEPAFFLLSAPPNAKPVPEPTTLVCQRGTFGCLEPEQLHWDTHYFESGPLAPGSGWTTLGTWTDIPFEVGTVPIVSLSDLDLFLGLKNAVDVGARFDIQATVRIVRGDATTTVSSGLVRCVGGLAKAFVRFSDETFQNELHHATRVSVPLSPLQPALPPGAEITEVTLTVQVRLGTLADDSSCGGAALSKRLRVYFGETVPAAFRFIGQVPGRVQANVFLVTGPGLPSNLGTSVPATPTQVVKSPPVNVANGNPWQDVGIWSGALSPGSVEVVGVNPLRLWAGVKTRDAAASFDVRAILKIAANGETRIVEGLARCVSGLVQGPAFAKEVRIPFPELEELYLVAPALKIKQLRISTRMGTAADGKPCGGPSSAQELRLYFGSASHPAGVAFALEEDHDY